MKTSYNLMISLLIGLLFLSYPTYQTLKPHDCIQNSMDYEGLPLPEDEENNGGLRNLALTNPEPIRVTVDTTELSNMPQKYIDRGFKPFIEKQLEVAKEFLKDKLKVQRVVGNNKRVGGTCIDYMGPLNQDSTVGISDSDLHIYVTWIESPQTFLANAGPCPFYTGRRPTFGRIQFNLQNMENEDTTSLLVFEDNLEVSIHEITHILGFSGGMMKHWLNPQTGRPYGRGNEPVVKEMIRGLETTILTSPNVVAETRRHFNCPTAKGMQLENQGGSGSLGSHWERVVLQNEFMTASAIPTDAAYSRFTFALLQDSGWYEPDYSDLDELEWGKDKGCDFLTNCDYDQFREFSNSNKKQCTFYHSSIGYRNADYFSDSCKYVRGFSNSFCQDETLASADEYDDYFGNYYGQGSRCFESTIMRNDVSSGEYVRCHKFRCDENNNIYVNAGEEEYQIDRMSNQVVINGATHSGTINGPEDWDAFCTTYPKPCKDYCNANGYCQQNVCHCSQGFAGEDCLTVCPGEQVLVNGICSNSTTCPVNYTFHKPSKTCKN